MPFSAGRDALWFKLLTNTIMTRTSLTRLFEISYHYIDGEHAYTETIFFRGTHDDLEERIRAELSRFAGIDRDYVVWSYDEQFITDEIDRILEKSEMRSLAVSACEITRLDDL